MTPEVTRFAPSPTGHLHLGHALAALVAWRRAREGGGRFLLRLEDIDRVRCRREYAVSIEEDLRWLGLGWNGQVRVQSAHFAEYSAVLEALSARGLLYPCFCSRADIARSADAPHGPEGPTYPGTCRTLSHAARAVRIAAGTPYALRLDMGRALQQVKTPLTFEEDGAGTLLCAPDQFGDIVLGRKDVPASYHLCVTHDDALQGVTLVTRGEDLRRATDIHRLLQALMDWPAPRYAHHRLLTDAHGRRLAKRDKAETLRELRGRGAMPAQIRDRLLD